MSNFRTRLKAETAEAHDRVDAGYGALNITLRSDFILFLQGQYAGHVLTRSAYPPGQYGLALTERIEMIAKDLHGLDSKPIALERQFADIIANKGPYHALGLTYVIAGSLHGTNVLRKVWEASSDDVVLSASNFMNFSGLSPEWARVLSELKTERFSRPVEDDIIQAARHAFGLFETGLGLAKDNKKSA